MVNFDDRFIQLCIERNLDFESFKMEFYKSYGYYIDYNSLSNDFNQHLEISMLKDLCEFFDVSFNYLFGLSSNRSNRCSINFYDEIIGICSVVFSSDKYSDYQKKELYLKVSKMLNQ